MSGPLEGVRVLELGSVVLGPWACQILADMGADVIKVESPTGDSNRQVGPRRNEGMGALYLTCNRNKRSLVLDLKQPAGRGALLKLAESVDVFVHNYRPGAIDRLGLEYEVLRSVNPRLIYCGTYGYSRCGPYGERAAYDDAIQAASGVASLSEPLYGEPRYAPTVLIDKTTAMAVVYAVTAALYRREKTGVGQEIEVPMFETAVSFVMVEHLYGLAFDPPEGEPAYRRLMSPDRRPYRTSDGYIAVLPYTNAQWKTFCEIADRPDLADDERFKDVASRLTHVDTTYEEIAKTISTRTTAQWLEALEGKGIPMTRVNTLEDLLTDEQLKASGFWQTIDHPTEGRLRTTGFPISFSESPASIRRHPPTFGEHSAEVLREAGLDDEEIDGMLASGAVVQP